MKISTYWLLVAGLMAVFSSTGYSPPFLSKEATQRRTPISAPLVFVSAQTITNSSLSGSGSGGDDNGLFDRGRAVLAAISFNGTIYSAGDLTMRYPVEGSALFVTAVMVASVLEWLLDYLKDVESSSFQLVFQSVREETLIVGMMTMILIFVTSLGVLRDKWVTMLNYAVMSLMGMVVFFMCIITAMVVISRVQVKKWRAFEAHQLESKTITSAKEDLFRALHGHYHLSVVAKDAKFNNTMLFAEYLRKTQKYTLAAIADLSWKSWAALGLMIVINGVRSRFTTGVNNVTVLSDADRLSNVATYVGFVGYGTMIFYFVIHQRLYSRLKSFTEDVITKPAKHNPNEVEITKPSSLLFFGSYDTTCQVVQSCILFMEWYLAVFGLGMVYESWKAFGWFAFLLYFAALIPPVAFVAHLPWTLTIITALNFLGDDLHVEESDAVFEDAVEALGTGAGIADTNTAGQLQTAVRADEFNAPEQPVTLHTTAANKSLLDTDAPLTVQDANHVNTIPLERSGFTKSNQRPAFPLLVSQDELRSGKSNVGGRGSSVVNSSMVGSPELMRSASFAGRSFAGSPRGLTSNASFIGGGGLGGSAGGSALGSASPSPGRGGGRVAIHSPDSFRLPPERDEDPSLYL